MGIDLLKVLQEKGFLILDGGLGTELEKRGVDLNHPLWSARALLECPEKIKATHLDYLRAGADILTTASYQASVQALKKNGIDPPKARELLELSVDLAREAVQEYPVKRKVFVAASIGSFGAYLADRSEYRGSFQLTRPQLKDFHRAQVEILAGKADLLIFETIPSLEEALAIAEVLEEFPQVRALLSFSLRDERSISEGRILSVCALELEEFAQIISIGANCFSPTFAPLVIRELQLATEKPILIYPNAGSPMASKKVNASAAGMNYGALVRLWVDAGASIVGGCCGVSPGEIQGAGSAMLM